MPYLDEAPRTVPGNAETRLAQAEEALQQERTMVSAILDTVATLVVVLDSDFRILRFNRACERSTGYSAARVRGKHICDLFSADHGTERFRTILEQTRAAERPREFECEWRKPDGARLLISWTVITLPEESSSARFVATGIDITENRRLESTVLEVSAREQRRIGQDLHDGLGQHLTGIAFMTKVQEQKLLDRGLAESLEAGKIVQLVNEAIRKTRELARGLLPVSSGPQGLMAALQEWTGEVEDIFQISCKVWCDDPVLIDDDGAADHLFRIAQEAVNNAIRHGNARAVTIGLTAGEDKGVLTIRDDGCGMPFPAPPNGMGLRIMKYRSDMIGGSLYLGRIPGGGTRITCMFPLGLSR